jgi:uroporphyrinogen-III decarboxylase
MTSRERIVKAMNMQHPDRVPLMCQFSIGFMNQQLKGARISPMELWLDAEKYAEALLFLREKFRFDGILVSLHGHSVDWRDSIRKTDVKDGMEIATFHDRTEYYPDNDLPYADFFQSRQRDPADVSPEEIPEELNYIPASKDCYVFIDTKDPCRIFDILNNRVKNECSMHGEITSPFDYLLDLLGYENALVALITDADKCKRILQRFTEGILKMSERICSKNIDAIKISSPFTGMGFISPEFYREFELPYITQLSDFIKSKGKFVYLHTCGHIDDRLEQMKESGASGLECLDPPPIGNVELEDAFKRIGPDMFIKGNIDSVNTLLHGSAETIEQDVQYRLSVGKKYPGFILSTACSIAPMVEAAKLEKLFNLVEKYGNYYEKRL